MADRIKDIPFIGKGWAFPPEFDIGKGGIVVSEGDQDIRESLEILVSTKLGERLMIPNYGCDLSDLLFESLSLTLERFIETRVYNAIINYEPRITVESIKFIPRRKEGIIYIDIKYIVKTTNARTNMVYPFYISEGTNL